MPIRLLMYMTEIWREELKNTKENGINKTEINNIISKIELEYYEGSILDLLIRASGADSPQRRQKLQEICEYTVWFSG